MSLMELTLATAYGGQIMINRWNYVQEGVPAAVSKSFALVSAFGAIPTAGVYPLATPMAYIAQLMVIGSVFQSIEARDVYSDTDFYATGFSPAYGGTQSGEGLSPTMSVGFLSSRVRRDIRRATKRFSGIPETYNGVQGAIPPASFSGPVLEMAASMGFPLLYDDEGNSLTFTPAVVKKQKYVVPDSDPVRYAYRYIPDADGGEAAQLADTAAGISWTAYNTLRTQTSRQYGRGI